jgi:hypothetical protein
MGTFLKDVEDYDSAEMATRSGVWGSLGFAIWMVVSTAWEFARTDLNIVFGLMTQSEQFVMIAMIAGPIAVSLFSTWRFKLGKGLIAGSITLIVLIAQVGLSLANGYFMGILGYVIAFAILMSLINGLRGAWALREMPNPEEATEVFE